MSYQCFCGAESVWSGARSIATAAQTFSTWYVCECESHKWTVPGPVIRVFFFLCKQCPKSPPPPPVSCEDYCHQPTTPFNCFCDLSYGLMLFSLVFQVAIIVHVKSMLLWCGECVVRCTIFDDCCPDFFEVVRWRV